MAKFILSAFADEAGSTLAEQINALCENEINYIEPRSINGQGILDFKSEELIKIKKQLTENGIKVNSLGSPIGKYDIDRDFDTHFELFKKAVDACIILGTKNMRIFSYFVKPEARTEKRTEVIQRLKAMTEYADKSGILLCHENESGIYGQNPKEVSMLLDELPLLYGIFDPANYIINGQNPLDGIEATLKRFKYMHIKDAIFETQAIVPPGEGEGKLEEIFDIINHSIDGEVFLTVEPHLALFDAYKSIDRHELKGKYSFKSNREAFDFAVNSLKNLLTQNGYKRNGDNQWTK